eukprot:TRINITY_DN2234_c1_g1_i1.p1 TRINITY_DN2234_c1_g1~~TRINITY_DN2234_c1_g1_i1.p1  ORF type:complete len:101 (-),score=23.45 TRINITY_DN2234_c1_g1_i1:520-822(-)
MSDSILTIRLIRSFEYRTTKNMILTGLCLSEITVSQLKSMIREKISSNPSFKAYQNLPLDTLKIYSKAHGAKVNLRDDFNSSLCCIRRREIDCFLVYHSN